jgi:hypothetical protein
VRNFKIDTSTKVLHEIIATCSGATADAINVVHAGHVLSNGDQKISETSLDRATEDRQRVHVVAINKAAVHKAAGDHNEEPRRRSMHASTPPPAAQPAAQHSSGRRTSSRRGRRSSMGASHPALKARISVRWCSNEGKTGCRVMVQLLQHWLTARAVPQTVALLARVYVTFGSAGVVRQEVIDDE